MDALTLQPKDSIVLKWGTLKAWDIKSRKAQSILRRYLAIGYSMSAAMQRDTPKQKELLCSLIDAANLETVYLDWDGKDVSKSEAQDYIRNYGAEK